jgi:hypothetical protein
MRVVICGGGVMRRTGATFPELITGLGGHQNCYKGFGSFGGDEATHNSGGGDASGNAAFAPRLPPPGRANETSWRIALSPSRPPRYFRPQSITTSHFRVGG